LLRVGIMPDANRLHNEEAKRIANEGDFLMLSHSELDNISWIDKMKSVFT